MRFSISVVIALAGCTKATEPPRTQQAEPKPRVQPHDAPAVGSNATTDPDEPCPKQGGPQTTAVRRIGLYGRVYPHELGHVWLSNKDYKVIMDGRPIESASNKDVPKGFIAVSKLSWFAQRCDDKGCGPHGTGKAIDRIDRKTQQVTKLAGPENEIVFAEGYAGQLYWGTFGPDGASGELRRVPEAGGRIETLWTGEGVHTVLIKNSTAYVADRHTVSSVPIGVVGKPIQLAKDLVDARGLAVDDQFVYFVDRGGGAVFRVPLAGGKVEKLAGPVTLPTVVGVDNDRVYFMGDRSGDVWALPKAGGRASILIPTPPKDWPCRSTKWLKVTDKGLQYLRMSEGFDTGTNELIDWGTLWSIPRNWMQDPIKQFSDYVAKNGSGAAAAGSDADP